MHVCANNSFLYRNRANTSYPYQIGNLITIKTSTSTWWPNQFYYFYYDMIFQKNCIFAETFNCISEGDCQDPGDGTGQYFSLGDCLNSCVSTSIDQVLESKKLLNGFSNEHKDLVKKLRN